MKILLCGGAKTTNIANALRPRFKKGGVEILVETSIDNIKSLLDRGEYFDRAVIMEPGWTNDGSDTDEYSIRTRIAGFIDIVRNYASRVTSCIFVATDDNMAQIAGEESILIANQCKILIKRPPYNVAFCISLVTSNLDEFDSSLVFELKPEDNTEEEQHIVYSTPAKDIQDSEAYDLEEVQEFEFKGDDSIELSETEDELRISSNDISDTTSDFDKEFDESNETAAKSSSFSDLEDNFLEETQSMAETQRSLTDGVSSDFEDSFEDSEESNGEESEYHEEDGEIASESFDDFDGFDETDDEYSEEYSDTEDELDGIPLDEEENSEYPDDTLEDTGHEQEEDNEYDENGSHITDDAIQLQEHDDTTLTEEHEEFEEPEELNLSEYEGEHEEFEEPEGLEEPEELNLSEYEGKHIDLDEQWQSVSEEAGELIEATENPEDELTDTNEEFSTSQISEEAKLDSFELGGIETAESQDDILSEPSDAVGEVEENENMDEKHLSELADDFETTQGDGIEAIELSEEDEEQNQSDNTEDVLASLFGGSDNISSASSSKENDEDELTFSNDKLSLSEDGIDGESDNVTEYSDAQTEERELGEHRSIGQNDENNVKSSQTNGLDIEKSVSDLFGLNGSNNEEEQFSREIYIKDNERVEESLKGKDKKHIGKGAKHSLLSGLRKRNVSDTEDDTQKLQTILNTFRNRGSSLVVTGTPCSGVSTLVFNLANIVSDLGYTVLIVDMDTVNRTQAYMNKTAYESVHSLDPENASLKQALNASNSGISKYASIIKPGFHILTMGLGGDIVIGEKLAPKQKLARFSSSVRNNYNFIIYDMPFDVATNYASDITYTADNVVLACEASNHGVMGLMLAMCNIDSEDMQEVMFTRSQLCFTKYTEFKRILDCNISNARDILRRLDMEVNSLLGIDPEYYFSNLSICGIMDYNTEYENSWFSTKAYSDSPNGKLEFIKLLTNILLKK